MHIKGMWERPMKLDRSPKKITSSKRATTSPKKGGNASAMMESGMSSTKKQVEYMQDKPAKKYQRREQRIAMCLKDPQIL